LTLAASALNARGMAKARNPEPAAPSVDLEALAAIAREAWERQGEAETIDASGARWRFAPQFQPEAALRVEVRQGTGDAEVFQYHAVSGLVLGCEAGQPELAATLARLSASSAGAA
jgi:hypothetical protein